MNPAQKLIIVIPPLLIAMVLHEIAHGYVAYKLGDPTSKKLGRLSLNPIVHLDPFMSVLLPAFLIFSGSPFIFGGAKPIPVNPFNLKNPKIDMALVAIAGPITNFVLAIISYQLLKLASFITIPGLELFAEWFFFSIIINVVLGVFNLFPIPPLDGSRIINAILPDELSKKYYSLEPYGMLILIVFLSTGLLETILGPIYTYMMQLIAF